MTQSFKNRERRLLEEMHHHKYELHESFPSMCFYCGGAQQSIDHCPPLICLDTFGADYFRKHQIPLVLVRSCMTCNGMLGAKHLFTVLERVEYLRGKLEAAYQKRSTLWSVDELKTLNKRSLRPGAIKYMAEAKAIHTRVLHLQARAVDHHLMPVYVEPSPES